MNLFKENFIYIIIVIIIIAIVASLCYKKYSKKTKNNELKKENDDSTPLNTSGLDAIENECKRIYPDQLNPLSFSTIIAWELGGNCPLRTISIYDGGDYWHFVTYGFSELFDKKSDNKDISGYGMEFTFKLKKRDNDRGEIDNICSILEHLARITFTEGEIFRTYEYIVFAADQCGIDVEGKSLITGFITIPDNKFKTLNTPNGKVEFIELIGATDTELKALLDKKIEVKEFYEKLGSDITDYDRKSIM